MNDELRFSDSSEARQYVYGVLATMLEHELTPEERDGWIFGGIEFDADKLLLRRVARDVIKALRKKAQR